MCTNKRKIRNKYTGNELYVKCGHCPACLQEKASYRVSRIKSNDSMDTDVLLVSLTYRRHDVPYIRRSEAFDFSRGLSSSLNVYRDNDYRKVRQNASYDINYKLISGTKVISSVDYIKQMDFHHCKDLVHKPGCIGVTYYPDLQHFLARLRLNLKRNFSYDKSFKVYSCSEYGSKSHRPHFHLLFWIPKGFSEVFRSAIVSSWPYGDISKWRDKAVQVAFSASSYVASYVNCGSDFPPFLQQYFPPKHSYSKDFGFGNRLFQLPFILEKFKRGTLSYNLQKVENGLPTIVNVPFPKYVVHRYFPQIKGYNRIPPSSLCSVLERIAKPFVFNEELRPLGSSFYEYGSSLDFSSLCSVYKPDSVDDYNFVNQMAFPVYYSDEEFYRYGVRLSNAYRRFLSCLPPGDYYTLHDYFKLHKSIWSCYSSTVLRLHLENEDVPLSEKYDNIGDYVAMYDYNKTPLPVGFKREDIKETDPNKFFHNMVITDRFAQSFHDNIKHRRVSNTVFSLQNEEF